jgi:hypothetical protein
VSIPVIMSELVELLDDRNDPTTPILATSDPIEASNNRPCLLVVPPAVDYAGGTFDTPNMECRVMALAASSVFGETAVDEIAALLDHAGPLLPELQRAEPTLYRLTPETLVPAYVLTFDTL